MRVFKYRNIVIILLLLLIFFDFSFATSNEILDYFKDAKPANLNTTSMRNEVFSILTWIGYACAIALTLTTAIGFIIATPAKKAKLKEKLWLIATGVILLAGGIPLLQIVADLFEEFGSKL